LLNLKEIAVASRNDITGDYIQTKTGVSEEYDKEYERIFGKKRKTNGGWTPPPIETHKILRPETKWEGPPIDFDEDRIDTIGQNGNDGDHYEQTD
jgi:hypothetical protein